jgi:hypothetical protein
MEMKIVTGCGEMMVVVVVIISRKWLFSVLLHHVAWW